MKRSLGGGAGGDVFILKPLHRLISLCINAPPAIKAHNLKLEDLEHMACYMSLPSSAEKVFGHQKQSYFVNKIMNF